MTTIHIKSKIITPDFKVYALFPGQGYKHRQTMIDNGVVFLDFPGLELPTDKAGYASREFTKKIARSEDFSAWISGGKITADKPSSNLADFATRARGPKRGKYINSLEGLHLTAKKGELVIVPTGGHYDDIMVGELIEDSGKSIRFSPNPSYHGLEVPARRVRWIGRKPQHHVSEEFLRSIRTANPFVIVKKSDRRQIYDVAYPSYTLGEETFSTFEVKGETFTSRDDLFLQEFINYAAALSEHVNSDNDNSINSNITEAIIALKNPDFLAELAININSPGLISLLSKKTTPYIATALFALANASCSPDGEVTKPNSDDITLQIGGTVPDECTAKVEEAVRHSLEVMGYNEWRSMCLKAKSLSEGPQISVPIDVKK